MSIEQKLLEKLRPHAKRINDGTGNEFDFFPAVLLQVLEEQKRLGVASEAFSKTTDLKWNSYDTQLADLNGSVKQSNASVIDQQRDTRESLVQKITASDNGLLNRLDNLQGTLADRITKAEKEQNEKILALGRVIASLSTASEIEHRKTRKFLISAIVTLILGFGICFALLLRH